MRNARDLGLIVVVVWCLSAVVAIAAPNMQEGMWDIKGEMKLEGLPFAMPPMPFSFSKCMTKEDMVPQQKDKNQECTPVSTKTEGNTITWVTKCKDKKGAVTESTGKATYKGNGFDGTIHNVTTDAK